MPGKHALVVGGTGTLRPVVHALCFDYRTVSVIARSHARLSSLAREAQGIGGLVNPIPVDWLDTNRLALGLRSAMTAHGPIDLAVCWIHSDAPHALPTVLHVVSSEASPPRLFHIIGSAAADPTQVDDESLRTTPGIHHRRVVLGFVIEAARSRWLTNDEISRGVIEAIRTDAVDSTIGVVRPWDRRP